MIQKEKSTPSYMFLVDDRDRFGEQRFPIAPKLNLPGPGTYKIPDTLEDKANLVLIAEKQKKLLQEWFNCWTRNQVDFNSIH